MLSRVSIVSGAVAAFIGGAGFYFLADSLRYEFIGYSPERARETAQNIVLINPRNVGYPPLDGPGKYASAPVESEISIWLKYDKEIPRNSHSEFSLRLASNYFHRFPSGASSLKVSASTDIDIYSPRGTAALNGGPYEIKYFIDSAHFDYSVKWSVLPNKTGKKRVWLSDVRLTVGKSRLFGIQERDGFTKENLVYDEEQGIVKGDAYVEVLVLREDGMSQKRYGQIEILGAVMAFFFGGGLITWLVQRFENRGKAKPA